MKRWPYLAVLILLVSLCACGGDVSAPPTSQSEPGSSQSESSSSQSESGSSQSESSSSRSESGSSQSESSSSQSESSSSQSESGSSQSESSSSQSESGSSQSESPASSSASSRPAASSISPYSAIPTYSDDPENRKYVDPLYRETHAKVHPDLAAFESALVDLGIPFTISNAPDSLVEDMGAKSVRIYRVGGTRFTIYEFDTKGSAYSAIKEYGKINSGQYELPIDARREGFVLNFDRSTTITTTPPSLPPNWSPYQEYNQESTTKTTTSIIMDDGDLASSRDIIEVFINNIG